MKRLGLAVAVVIAVAAWLIFKDQETVRKESQLESKLQPFYDTPQASLSGKPGTLLRSEALDIEVPHRGQGFRVLYLSERPDGSPVVSSGMVFVPAGKPPAGGWPVVAWAHGTIGAGAQCAPSRSDKPLENMTWLGDMLQRRWVVAATDYVGLGTAGSQYYLIGKSEARDVLNSVRAARQLKKDKTSSRFALWGHSQGGHAVLFTASEAASYAPELKLVAAAAAAPAAQLGALLKQQWRQPVSWVIAPEIFLSWPNIYSTLKPEQIASKSALGSYKRSISKCVTLSTVLDAVVRNKVGEKFFKINPVSLPNWYRAARQETPPTLPPKLPLMIAQGLSDTVVLPNTTALYVSRACKRRSNLYAAWMGDVNHPKAAAVAGPVAASWLYDRFAGKPNVSTCGQPLPVMPAKDPPAPR